ncbi:hypothetical protein VCNHCC008D_001293B, partial [Vibrio cholerae O1 str. NHCC-008D]
VYNDKREELLRTPLIK